MATRASRLERELGDVLDLVQREQAAEESMSELVAIGISHKTAPVALRERLALTEREAERFTRELVVARGRARGGRDLDLQPHRDLPRRQRLGPGRGRAARQARDAGRDPPDRARRRRLLAAQLRRGAPPVPRHRRPRVDDRRRERGPGPGRRAYEARARGRHDRAVHEPPVPRRAATGKRVRSETAIGGGARQRLVGRGRRRARGGRRSRRPRRRDHRRRRDGRADGARARRAGRDDDVRRQPPRRPRARARRALRRQRRLARRAARSPRRSPTSSSPRPPRRT